MDTSQLLAKSIGILGPWQVMFVLAIYVSKFAVAWHQLVMVVHNQTPDFICKEANLDSCDPRCTEHVFDTSVWQSTIVTEWDLVCDKRWLAELIQTIVMAGIMIGNIWFGWLSDKFGRKKPLVWSIILQIVAGSAAAFAPWYIAHVVLRFLSAVATGGTMLVAFVLLMEFTAKKYSTPFGIMFQLPFHVGHALLGPIAYLTPRWDYIQMIISLPQIILLLYCCILPESPRWLLNMKRTDHIVEILEKAARCNRLPTDQIRDDVTKFVAEIEKEKFRPPGKLIDLVLTPRLRLKTLLLCLNWFIVACLFYGVAQLMGHIGGDVFINVFASGMVQVPGNLLCVVICDVIGRKSTMNLSYLFIFVPLFAMLVIPETPRWPTLVCGCISMMGCAMAFSTIYVYSSELFPTVVRNSGMGISSMCARIGSMISPFVMYVQFYGKWIPLVVFGTLPVIGIISICIFLPETNKMPFVDTIEESENI